jgi:hypothetical protein
VNYVDQSTAQSDGLIGTSNGSIYMGVDHTNVASGSGRSSVRLTSTKSYTHGLIILDVEHMPGGICGTWPAFWTVGPNWPNAGEIDIIEGVNSQTADAMTLHTADGCSITNNGDFSGSVVTPQCGVDASGQATNAGCQILTSNSATYGSGFNEGEGGVYATEWTSSAISIWFFARSAIPSDISAGSPDPTGWGNPLASFSGGCDIDDFFMDHQIVFDTTFCGDWAGNVWTADATCSALASTCQDFVQNNPSAFEDAYWSVNSLMVYQSNGAESNTTSSSAPIIPLPTWASSAAASWGSAAVPTVVPTSVVPSQVPTAGFSRGGNGRFTKTLANADFAVESSASDSSAAAVVTATPVADDANQTVQTVTVTALTYADFSDDAEKRDVQGLELDFSRAEKRAAAPEPRPRPLPVLAEEIVEYTDAKIVQRHMQAHKKKHASSHHKHANNHPPLHRRGGGGGLWSGRI